MFLCFKKLIQPDYIPLPGPLKYNNLLHDFLSLRFFAQILFVNRFDSHELLCEFVQSQVHFTESTFTEHFTYSVEIDSGVRGLLSLFEGEEHVLSQLGDASSARGEVLVGDCGVLGFYALTYVLEV